MNPNVLYNAVTTTGLLAMFVTEGVKSICAAFGLIIKGKWALLTFLIVWAVINFYPWLPVPPDRDLHTGNNLWYLIHSLSEFLAAIGVYNFVRRFFNAIEGMRNQPASKK